MRACIAMGLVVSVSGCSGAASDTAPARSPTGAAASGTAVSAYMLEPGRYQAGGMFRAPGVEVPWELELDRRCEQREGRNVCTTEVTRTAEGEAVHYVSRTEERATGEHEVYYKDEEGERVHDSLVLPAPDRLPLSWNKISADGQESACTAARDDTWCPGGMRMRCEKPNPAGVTVAETRIVCPDRGKTQRRHLGTFTPLCEQLLDMSYDRWRGAEVTGERDLYRASPRRCRRTTPVGWARQTPNRDWSVALPDRGRMVLGPDKWTVNLHQGEMSFIAYEGTGPNATVKSDEDVPPLAIQVEQTVGQLIGARVGKPVKRQGQAQEMIAVDWLIPLTAEDGSFAGALRLIAHDGRMFSLTSTGPDEKLATEFLESFEIHEAGFGARAAGEFTAYVAAGVEFRDRVCACKTLECAHEVPQPTPPSLGFPTDEQEQRLGELSNELNECASRMSSPEP